MNNMARTLRAAGLSLAADIGELSGNVEAAVQVAGTNTDELREMLELALEDLYDVATKHNTRYWDMVTTGCIELQKNCRFATGGRDTKRVIESDSD